MAIIDVRRLRKLQLTETVSSNGIVTFAGSEELLIIVDSASTTFGDIAADSTVWPNIGGTIPRLFTPVPYSGTTLYATSRKFSYPDSDNDRIIALTINYESRELEDETEEEPKPTDSITPDMTVQSVIVEVPAKGWFSRDEVPDFTNVSENGQPALNSASDPVDGLTEETSMVKMTYTNTICEDPNFSALLAYANTCNDGAFLGGGDYTVKCNGYSCDYDPKTALWSVSVEFLYNPKGWAIEYYDVGYNQLAPTVFDRSAITDTAGNPVTKPVALNIDGTAKNVGEEPDIRKLYPYKTADFTNLFSNCRI